MNTDTAPLENIDNVIELYNENNLNESIKEIKYLIELYPNDPILFNIAGACHAGLGELQKAVESYQQAILLKPDFADFHYNLGNTLKEIGHFKEAVKSYKNVLKILPDNYSALFNLGASYQELEKLDDAAEAYEKSIKSEPNKIEAKINLGFVCHKMDQLDDAIFQYEQVLMIDPENIEALNNLGVIYRELDQIDESINFYKKALLSNPKYSQAYYNLGFAYQDLGDREEAIKHYEKAVEINNHSWSYHNLSYLKSYKVDDPQIKEMESLLDNKNLPKLDQIHLNLALAQINENLGNQEDFIKFLNKGNALRKKELNYSTSNSERLHLNIKEIFASPVDIINNTESSSEISPIFIVGMPRSGTSLLEQILSSHHEVYGAGELEKITKLAKPIINNFSEGEINNLEEQALLYLRNEYLDNLLRFRTDASVITDKLPLNFQYIGFILAALPESKIVHIKRDSIATCWSNYKHFFTSKENGYSHNFDDIVAFYKSYVDLMDFWHKKFPNKIYDISYEELTLNQEKESRKLLNYCDLDWDENCLNFYENNRAVKTPSALQVRKKIYQNSSNDWKKHKKFLQPLIKGLEDYC